MKKSFVFVMAMLLIGCASAQMRTESTWELIDQEPIFEMMTEVCDPWGNEMILVKTFQRNLDGTVRLIDSKYIGGPGIGYALSVTGLDTTGDVASAGIIGLTAIEAASKLRPDTTRVTQTGGGATSTGVSGSVTGNSGTIEGGSGGVATATTSTTNTNVSGSYSSSNAIAYQTQDMQQTQGQQQQMQQQQVQQPIQQPKPKPTVHSGTPSSVKSVQQSQRQNMVVGVGYR